MHKRRNCHLCGDSRNSLLGVWGVESGRSQPTNCRELIPRVPTPGEASLLGYRQGKGRRSGKVELLFLQHPGSQPAFLRCNSLHHPSQFQPLPAPPRSALCPSLLATGSIAREPPPLSPPLRFFLFFFSSFFLFLFSFSFSVGIWPGIATTLPLLSPLLLAPQMSRSLSPPPPSPPLTGQERGGGRVPLVSPLPVLPPLGT